MDFMIFIIFAIASIRDHWHHYGIAILPIAFSIDGYLIELILTLVLYNVLYIKLCYFQDAHHIFSILLYLDLYKTLDRCLHLNGQNVILNFLLRVPFPLPQKYVWNNIIDYEIN